MYKPTGRHARFLKRAYELAKESSCRHKHGAVVVRNGNILAMGNNIHRELNAADAADTEFFKKHASIHAEVAAVRQVANPQGCTVYVARVMADGSPGLSKPCHRCAKYLEEMGVRRVVWT